MASFEEDMESLVELRVRHWRPAIVQCIQTHQLCTRLASKGIITDASNELLDLVLKKQQAGKWALFLEALDDEGPIHQSTDVGEKEHLLEDKMEYEPSNDLNAPAPSTSETFESKSETEVQEKELQKGTGSGNLIYSTIDNENLKDLNIKPERMKSVEEFKDKTIESDEESEEENTLASDYEGSDAEEEEPKPHSLELRDYQIELAEEAIKGRNTIICAETGTGKTWVALHIVASHLAKAKVVKMVIRVPDPGKDILLNAMDDTESLLEDMAFLQPDLTDLMIEKKPAEKESQAYNKWTVDLEKAAQLNVTDHETARDISSCARYLNVYNSALEVNNLLQLKHVIKYLADKHNLEMQGKSKHTDQEKILFKKLLDVQKNLSARAREKDTENPNVKIVSNQLRQMIEEKGDDSRAIVFVKARATCRALAEYINRDLENIGVSAHPLYGQQTRGADEGMTESVQTETVEKFREGHYKVMVCTSVGTEGIDVPDCNIVVNYNYSGDEITKIQMKGRSRKKGATHVIVGGDKQVEQEMVNAYKANMMYKAMDEFKRLNPKNIGYKVAIYQKEEMQKHRYKMEYEKAKKSKMSEDDLEILCRRCNTKACLVSDIRKLGHDHLVLDKSFANRITTKPHKSPKKYDGIEKKSKMFCKKCPLDWGIVAERDGVDLWILKIQCFKFRNMRSADVSAYKKWIEVPYAVPEMNLEDIPKFFGTVDEVACF
ncbi:IFIH1-like protein [Mya arenaria]|uniref:RNA helicase n=1 Tax=Mya arenaria TaxID=6604 RepID=A0ABY7FJE9_MYAAR|nr:IFIH1-like protein [Mya arenaria]